MKNEEIVKHLVKHGVIINYIKKDVQDIKKNHLPHIYKQQTRLLFVVIGGLISLLIAILVR